MLSGLNLETAKTVALVAVVVALILSVTSAILLKSIAQKLAVAAILGLVALLVWTQRASLDTCAQLVRESVTTNASTTCTFFGQDVDIPRPSRTDS